MIRNLETHAANPRLPRNTWCRRARAMALVSVAALAMGCGGLIGLDDLHPRDAGGDAAPPSPSVKTSGGPEAGAEGASKTEEAGTDAATCGPGMFWVAGKCAPLPGYVPGGTFTMGQPVHRVTVSPFVLDVDEVTVGRFREFFAQYPKSKPAEGDGEHPHIASSGWRAAWDAYLPATADDLAKALTADPWCTWTASPGATEESPISCIDWYTAFAFCAWDGGRLPTEAEWEFAARGGPWQTAYPWGNEAPRPDLAIYYLSEATRNGPPAIRSALLGKGRFGQFDLAGSIMEWVLDASADYPANDVVDYASLTESANREARGGSWIHTVDFVASTYRAPASASSHFNSYGIRCARDVTP